MNSRKNILLNNVLKSVHSHNKKLDLTTKKAEDVSSKKEANYKRDKKSNFHLNNLTKRKET